MDQAIRATMLADQIRDYLATWVAREFPGSFLGITAVTLAPNMRKATVWVSLPEEHPELFHELERKTKHYQHLLVTHLVRYKVPSISFAVDNRDLSSLPN